MLHAFAQHNWRRVTSIISVIAALALVFTSSCSTSPTKNFHESGRASWYGQRFHGKRTASGERFDMHELTAAHPSLAFGTKVQVRSMTTGKSVVVRINDRGPYAHKRVIDLSFAAARKLGIVALGEDDVVINQIP